MTAHSHKVFLLALLLLVGAPNAGAQQYVGASVGNVDFEDFAVPAIIVRYGMQFNDFFSAEVRYGQAVAGDATTLGQPVSTGVHQQILGIRFDHELDQMYGLYGRYGLPLDDAITWYVTLGYSFVEHSYEASISEEIFLDDTGFLLVPEDLGIPSTGTNDWASVSFGFGTDWHFQRWWTFNFEYTGYIRERNLYIDGLSLGIVRQLR